MRQNIFCLTQKDKQSKTSPMNKTAHLIGWQYRATLIVHRTIFAVLLTPETKHPVRGKQLDLSVVEKLETTLLERVVHKYSVPLGVHPIWHNAIPVWESCPFLCLPVICEIAEIIFCPPCLLPPLVPIPPRPPPNTFFYLRLCFCILDWFFLGTMRVRHARQATFLFAPRPMVRSSAATSLRRGSPCERRWDWARQSCYRGVASACSPSLTLTMQRGRPPGNHKWAWVGEKISGRVEQHLQTDLSQTFKYLACLTCLWRFLVLKLECLGN